MKPVRCHPKITRSRMEKINHMIAETREWREFHAAQYRRGVRGAQIEASACAIREKALLDARAAISAAEREVKP